MKEGRVCRFIFFQTLLCSGYIEGLSLHAASDLTKQSFTLVCDLEGASVSNAMSFTYNGTSAGGCSGPPGAACFSSIGTIAWSNQMVNFTLNQNEITSKGNALWTCTHGIDPASLTTTVIALCTNIEVKYADQKIDISCSCGFPSVQAEVNYKASQNGNSLGSQTFDLASSPGINCTTDNRAMDYSFKIENFPSGTAEVCATVKTYSQITTPTTICKPVPDCSQDIFLYGFLPVFLIVLIASIAIIILKIDFLSKQFGEFTWKKGGITAVFFVIAVIIGVCLGLLIKGCDKKFLALGLSLFFGILLVVALIFALIYYHKKCESGSGVPERVLDYIQCSQLGQ